MTVTWLKTNDKHWCFWHSKLQQTELPCTTTAETVQATDTAQPKIPMRPTVSFCGSPTYQLSKHLNSVLNHLTDEPRNKLQSTENFICAIKTVQVPIDHKLVSLDMKFLFTIIPLQLAIDYIETSTNNSIIKLPLPTDDLRNLRLTSAYFPYNGKHYKQLHGTAMGSPVSVVVTEIVMQNREERALATYNRILPLWLRYVDDTFTETKSTIFTNISTDKTPIYSWLRKSKKMVKYLF